MLLASLLVPSSAPANPNPSEDPGGETLLIQARQALWAGQETAAVPMLRRYLGQRPQDQEARLDLARALAWSGRLSEAMGAYKALEAGGTENPDALAGMADLLSWSGRKAEALDLYKKAAAAAPGREELQHPVSGLAPLARPGAAGEADHLRDSGGVETWRSVLAFRPGEAQRHGPVVLLIREEVSGPAGGNDAALQTMGAAAGWDGLAAAGLRVRAAAGATWTEEKRPRAWSQAVLSLRTLYRISLDLTHTFRDRGHDLNSVRARRDGLTGHEVGLSSYRSFTADSGIFAKLRAGSLSDGNAYRGGDASLDLTLMKRENASWLSSGRGILSLYALDYDSGSGRYYAAQKEWSAAAGMSLALYRDRRLGIEGSFKTGRAGNQTGRGEVLGAGGAASWTLSPGRVLEAGFTYDQSIQAGTYIWRTWRLGTRWGF